MTTLHVFSNRHINAESLRIKKGDWIYLENELSRRRWSLFFAYNGINEAELAATYITQAEFFALSGPINSMKFDTVVGNPPYGEKKADLGRKVIGGNSTQWIDFVKQTLQISKKFSLVVPRSILAGTGTGNCILNLRRALVANGLKHIRLLPLSVFENANVSTCVIEVENGHSGDVTVQYEDGSTMQFSPNTCDYFLFGKSKFESVLLQKVLTHAATFPFYRVQRGKVNYKTLTKKGSIGVVVSVEKQSIPRYKYLDVDPSIPDINAHKVGFKYSPVHKDSEFKTMSFGYEKPFYVPPGHVVCEGSYSYFVVASEGEATDAIEWLTSPLASWILMNTRSQRSRDNTQFFALSKVRPHNLTPEEIDYIEANVK